MTMVARNNGAGQAGANSPKLLKVAEVAYIVSISTRTLWRLVSAGKFPQPMRIGGSTRWRAADVEHWIEAGCTKSSNDQQ